MKNEFRKVHSVRQRDIQSLRIWDRTKTFYQIISSRLINQAMPIVHFANNLRKHALTKERHEKERKVRVTNTSLPVSYYEHVNGAADNVHDKELCDSGKVVARRNLLLVFSTAKVIQKHI